MINNRDNDINIDRNSDRDSDRNRNRDSDIDRNSDRNIDRNSDRNDKNMEYGSQILFLTEALKGLCLEVPGNKEEGRDKLQQLLSYYELLVERNKVMNLTSITEFEDVVIKHFIDSLSLCKLMELSRPMRVLDLGTGAGFPGIPLKIMFPQLQVTLMDSLNKRIVFLEDVIQELKLEQINAVHGRAEDLARKPEYRDQFDLVVSRAVANLSSLSEYCIPFVKKGGFFVAYKSGDVEKEVQEAAYGIKLLGGKKEQVYQFQLPDTDISRSFVKIKKVMKTPKAFPRKAGLPSREPLHS